MAIWQNKAITNIGANIISRAYSEDKKIIVTNFVMSSKNYSEYDLHSITDIEDIIQIINISNKISVDNSIKIVANVNNSLVEQPYNFYTYGLYAHIEGEYDILLAIGTTDSPDIIPNSVIPYNILFEIRFIITDNVQIDVIYDPYALATKDDLEEKQDKMIDGSGISIGSDNSINHTNSITAGSIGSGTSIPKITYDGQGHITAVAGQTVYPPTTVGTATQYWKGDGSGAGIWQNAYPPTTVGTANQYWSTNGTTPAWRSPTTGNVSASSTHAQIPTSLATYNSIKALSILQNSGIKDIQVVTALPSSPVATTLYLIK